MSIRLKKNNAIEKRCQLIRLFGIEKEGIKKPNENNFDAYLDYLFKSKYGEDAVIGFRKEARKNNLINKDGMGKGRLHFYPTFFDKIGLEVVNPHDRRTKAGATPVNIECAPEGAKGTFSLLYLAPFNTNAEAEAKKDWDIICDAINKMMLEYGFSAKKSSGYGVIEKKCLGIVFKKRTNKGVKDYADALDAKNLELSAIKGIYAHEQWKMPESQVKMVNNKIVIRDFKSLAGLQGKP